MCLFKTIYDIKPLNAFRVGTMSRHSGNNLGNFRYIRHINSLLEIQ